METFVINRQDRPDRLHDIRIELENQGMNAHHFEAVIDKVGYIGCTRSHLGIMERCRSNNMFLILEDDCEFLQPKETTDFVIKNALNQLCSDWDALYLGASPQEPQERYSNNLFRLRNAKCTHAILWHNRPNGALQYILEHKHDIGKIDRYLYEVIMPKFQIYATYPMLVTQKQTRSDIAQRSDCSTILKNYNKYCK
jgi:GR25 family glycosyltransferase involved in LPS biosynthesis